MSDSPSDGPPRKAHGQNRRFQQRSRNQAAAKFVGIDESNPVLCAFRAYSEELDDKHDRYERVIKLSRDICIESKRIIFTLHSIDPNDLAKKEIVLKEVGERLLKICATNFAAIADELHGRDPYQYGRAYSAGLQEFIEAYSFYEYISESPITDWTGLQERLKFDLPAVGDGDENALPVSKQALVQPIEFMLGLADLSGEVMRRCVNSLGSGLVQTCFDSCNFMQQLYAGYMTLNVNRVKDMNFKIYTMKGSVLKCEAVCYNIKVRGKEAAKWGSMVTQKKQDDEDEGFY
jgi:predicted translin family RNA/ssDNA-binding protein